MCNMQQCTAAIQMQRAEKNCGKSCGKAIEAHVGRLAWILKDIAICLLPLRWTAEQHGHQEAQSSDKVAPAVSQETVQKVSFVARAACSAQQCRNTLQSCLVTDGRQDCHDQMIGRQLITSQTMLQQDDIYSVDRPSSRMFHRKRAAEDTETSDGG